VSQLEIDTKSKYCEDPNYSGIFKFQIAGIVNRNDILGTLYKKTNTLGSEYGLSSLNQRKKLGLISINLFNDTKSNETTGQIKVPMKADEKTACLICAIIQTIDKVGSYKAIFRFRDFQQESTNLVVKIVKRAKNIYQTKLLKYKQGISEIIQSLFSNLMKIQIKEIHPGIWIGPKYIESQEIYLLEGRADIVNLSKSGIYNTISVNGLDTPKQIQNYILNKTLTCMFDKDRGGETILYNLSSKYKIDFYIDLPDNSKVQELAKSQVLNFANKRKIFDYEKYKKYYSEKYLNKSK
jgi:DNA primase